MRKDRRVGYDFTFDASKSVSILYGITDDPAILAAFRWAVAATMEEMEAGVKTRVRKRGQFAERIVGNMAWAEFLHFTARPVKGVIDPHLHAHCFVPNLCWDHAEHAWKAIDVASVKEGAPYWQARFQKRFRVPPRLLRKYALRPAVSGPGHGPIRTGRTGSRSPIRSGSRGSGA
jgi:conjugative relaxase-like TrwC/TraI family protein